jgi:hypothetical protein
MFYLLREASRVSQLALPAPAPVKPSTGKTLGDLFRRSGNVKG